MSPTLRTPPHTVVKLAHELRPLLALYTGEDATEWHPGAVVAALKQWANEKDWHSAANGSGWTFIGPDVVVKLGYQIASLKAIPVRYRPEQLTVWKGGHPLSRFRSIVIQPRYVVGADAANPAQAERFHSLTREMIAEAGQWGDVFDIHYNNVGLRSDGSPVLIDW